MRKPIIIGIFFSILHWSNTLVAQSNSLVSTTSLLDKYILAVCVIDTELERNIAYYHLPVTNTQLKCEINNEIFTGTFNNFYNDGWRLIQILNVDNRLETTQKTVPYSILYLEKKLL